MSRVLLLIGRAVQLKLDFLKPFEAHNQAEMRLVPQLIASRRPQC